MALTGVSGSLVEIEADLTTGLPGLAFTGLADVSVVESRDRIRSAIVNSGAKWLDRRVTLALLPADVRKVGSRFDLAIALAVLAATGAIDPAPIADAVWLAELGLDGALRPVRGALPAVLAARQAGVRRVVVARGNGAEAALVDSYGRAGRRRPGAGPGLADRRGSRRSTAAEPKSARSDDVGGPDLADVNGQGAAKRALEVAAAGRHHLYLLGPPGAGKTMLAERLPGLLPALDDDAALEVTRGPFGRRHARRPTPAWSADRRCRRRTTRRRSPRWSAVARVWPGPGRSRWPTTAWSSSTRRRSSRRPRSMRCASRSKVARS